MRTPNPEPFCLSTPPGGKPRAIAAQRPLGAFWGLPGPLGLLGAPRASGAAWAPLGLSGAPWEAAGRGSARGPPSAPSRWLRRACSPESEGSIRQVRSHKARGGAAGAICPLSTPRKQTRSHRSSAPPGSLPGPPGPSGAPWNPHGSWGCLGFPGAFRGALEGHWEGEREGAGQRPLAMAAKGLLPRVEGLHQASQKPQGARGRRATFRWLRLACSPESEAAPGKPSSHKARGGAAPAPSRSPSRPACPETSATWELPRAAGSEPTAFGRPAPSRSPSRPAAGLRRRLAAGRAPAEIFSGSKCASAELERPTFFN